MKEEIKCAVGILKEVYSSGAYLKIALGSAKMKVSAQLVTKICYGTVDNDIYEEYHISKLANHKVKITEKIILKIGIYCIKFLQVKDYAVTNACVEAAKEVGKKASAGFINAVLRRYIREREQRDAENDFLLRYSYPESIYKELVKDYGEKIARETVSFDRAYSFVRFKDEIDGEEYLKALSAVHEKTAVKGLFKVERFGAEEGFYRGDYTFQSIGSAAICEMIEGGFSLLDACAAPGGKSVNLSRKFNEVTACDLHSHRVNLIKSYADRMGAENITALKQDMTKEVAEWSDKFDAVLCDVPCSGSGVLKENPDIKLRFNIEEIESLCATQLKILGMCGKYVKPGGTLYYSTCSLFKRENEEVAKKFLDSNKDFVHIKDYSASPIRGIEGDLGIQFLPQMSEGAGFYFCKFKKECR